MSCDCEKEQKTKCTPSVLEVRESGGCILFRKVAIPASIGDETQVPPVIGKYKNVLLQYEVNGHLYLYSSDGIPTQISTDVDEAMTLIAHLERAKADRDELATVAFTGEYLDLLNEPQQFTTSEWDSLWT